MGCDTELEDQALTIVCQDYDYLTAELDIHFTRTCSYASRRKEKQRGGRPKASSAILQSDDSLTSKESDPDSKVLVITQQQKQTRLIYNGVTTD